MARTKKSSARGRSRSARSTGGSSRRTAVKPRKTAARAKKVKPSASRPARPRRKTRLGKKELAEFREMLLAKRRTLLGDLSGMEEQTAGQKGGGNLSSMPTHMADVGTDNFEHEFTLGLLESEQALLREIHEALARIDEGTFGICLGTGEYIPKARLRAKPWAKYTVDYTRLLEKGLVRPPEAQAEQDELEDESKESQE